MQVLNLRLVYEEKRFMNKKDIDILEGVRKAGVKNAKINSIKPNYEFDRKDQRYLKSIKNINLVYELKGNKTLTLTGDMQCVYKNNFKGEFFCKRARIDNSENDFSKIQGINAKINFSNELNLISNNELRDLLDEIRNDKDFIINISQFDDFMECFNYYKELFSEYNNNETFEIISIGEESYFLPIEEHIENLSYTPIFNANGVIIGYKLKKSEYVQLSNDQKEKVKNTIIISIAKNLVKKIRWDFDNIYISNIRNVNEHNVKQLKKINIYNYIEKEDKIQFLCEINDDIENIDYKFMNYYDMGQQIKIESIEQSLKLINKCHNSDCFSMIEFLIGDKPIPSHYEKPKNIDKYIKGLNDSQKQAFIMAISGSPISLIKGPPGTGKTHVINAIIQYITKELNEKVIISSQTHVAIDNVLDKLIANYDAIIPQRISRKKNKYSKEKIDKTLYETWANKFKLHNARSDSELAKILSKEIDKFDGEKKFVYSLQNLESNYKVIGATTTTTAISGQKGYKVLEDYNWLIIDEVSKSPITEILRYIPYVKKIIMVGDDYQLSPIFEISQDDVKHLEAFDEDKFLKLKQMYESSVFSKTLQKAKESDRLVLLNENYRSRKQILDLYNVFYNNELICKREHESHLRVKFLTNNFFSNEKDAYFVEVKGGKEALEGTSRYNLKELEATSIVLKKLIEEIINPKEITIAAIFPYAAQIEKFQKNHKDIINEAKKKFLSFEMNTVDAFQGREANIVLCNTVVADSSRKNFLNDFRRINVSLSRAQDKLIIFGNSLVLSNIEMRIGDNPPNKFFKDIINYIKINGKFITYSDGEVTANDNSENTIRIE